MGSCQDWGSLGIEVMRVVGNLVVALADFGLQGGLVSVVIGFFGVAGSCAFVRKVLNLLPIPNCRHFWEIGLRCCGLYAGIQNGSG